MVRPEEVVAELRQKLHEPQFARRMMERVETLVPDRATVRTFLEDAWVDTLRPHVVDWLVALDLREAWGSDGEGASRARDLASDPTLRAGVHRCLAQAVADPALSARLYRAAMRQYGQLTVFEIPPIPVVKPQATPVSLEMVARFALEEDELHQRLRGAVDGALGPGAGPASDTPLGQVTRDYARAYAAAWVEQPEAQRRADAVHLIDRIAPQVLDALADWLWEHHGRLEQLVSQDLPLNAHPLVEFLSEELGELLGDELEQLDERSQELLTDKLRQLGPAPFRQMLERRTRPELDWIQVNGAGLGFVLGLLAGGVAGWLH